MDFHVGILPKTENKQWDELVLSSSQRSVFALHEFMQAWEETEPGLHMVHLGCYDQDNRLVGGLCVPHQKIMGLQIPKSLTIYHPNSPIISGNIQQDNPDWRKIIIVLSQRLSSSFPSIRLVCHPSVADASVFLQMGWNVIPEYTHIWDIGDSNTVLKNMNHSNYVNKGLENFVCARESGNAGIGDFIELYREGVKKFNLSLDNAWEQTFRDRVDWMEAKDLFRLFTCRTKDGRLIGASTYILSRINHTAYGWLIALDRSINSKELNPTLYWYSASQLSNEFHYMNIGEGTSPRNYAAKDSLGTTSRLFWVLEGPSRRRLLNLQHSFKRMQKRLSRIFS